MTTTEILKAHAPEFVALDEAERKATPINLASAEYHQEAGGIDCPLCQGDGSIYCEGYTNIDGFALNVDFSGIGHEMEYNRIFVTEARNQTRALLDAHAQALLKLAEREWRPIDTAPKDGTRILAYFPVTAGKGDIHWEMSTVRFYCASSYQYGQEGYWETIPFCHPIDDPTHWQPIPTPPSRKETP